MMINDFVRHHHLFRATDGDGDGDGDGDPNNIRAYYNG
jgi:hypothetical protein